MSPTLPAKRLDITMQLGRRERREWEGWEWEGHLASRRGEGVK